MLNKNQTSNQTKLVSSYVKFHYNYIVTQEYGTDENSLLYNK